MSHGGIVGETAFSNRFFGNCLPCKRPTPPPLHSRGENMANNRKLHAFIQRPHTAYEINPRARKAMQNVERHLDANQPTAAMLEAENLIHALIE